MLLRVRKGSTLLRHTAAVHDFIVQRTVDDQNACQALLSARHGVVRFKIEALAQEQEAQAGESKEPVGASAVAMKSISVDGEKLIFPASFFLAPPILTGSNSRRSPGLLRPNLSAKPGSNGVWFHRAQFSAIAVFRWTQFSRSALFQRADFYDDDLVFLLP